MTVKARERERAFLLFFFPPCQLIFVLYWLNDWLMDRQTVGHPTARIVRKPTNQSPSVIPARERKKKLEQPRVPLFVSWSRSTVCELTSQTRWLPVPRTRPTATLNHAAEDAALKSSSCELFFIATPSGNEDTFGRNGWMLYVCMRIIYMCCMYYMYACGKV